ncbi:MAG: hypothetical protein WDW38_008681 [Sanguina aurantia]
MRLKDNLPAPEAHRLLLAPLKQVPRCSYGPPLSSSKDARRPLFPQPAYIRKLSDAQTAVKPPSAMPVLLRASEALKVQRKLPELPPQSTPAEPSDSLPAAEPRRHAPKRQGARPSPAVDTSDPNSSSRPTSVPKTPPRSRIGTTVLPGDSSATSGDVGQPAGSVSGPTLNSTAPPLPLPFVSPVSPPAASSSALSSSPPSKSSLSSPLFSGPFLTLDLPVSTPQPLSTPSRPTRVTTSSQLMQPSPVRPHFPQPSPTPAHAASPSRAFLVSGPVQPLPGQAQKEYNRAHNIKGFAATRSTAVFSNVDAYMDAYDSLEVVASGSAHPAPIATFNDLRCKAKLKENMIKAGFQKPTPVQKYAIPIIGARRDLLASAPTGSGKTAAYLIPIVGRLMQECREGTRNRVYPSVIILSPTRELAIQLWEAARKLTLGTHINAAVVHGGTPLAEQVQELRGGIDIVVATPGRLLELVESRRIIILSRLQFLVVDEADKMLDLNLEPTIKRLLGNSLLPPRKERQLIMFSATLPEEVQRLAAEMLEDYVYLTVGVVGGSVNLISQRVEWVGKAGKLDLLMSQLRETNGLTLVFANTVQRAAEAHRHLAGQGISVSLIHGEISQVGTTHTRTDVPATPHPERIGRHPCLERHRAPTIVAPTQRLLSQRRMRGQHGRRRPRSELLIASVITTLTNWPISRGWPAKLTNRMLSVRPVNSLGSRVLVATGVAARGLDIPDVTHVVNVDMPAEIDEYIHRIGRTGRAGRQGVATTFFSALDSAMAVELSIVLRQSLQEVPEWLEGIGHKGHLRDLRPAATARPMESLDPASRTPYSSYLEDSSLQSATQQSVQAHTPSDREIHTGNQQPDFRLTDRQYQDQALQAWKQAIGDTGSGTIAAAKRGSSRKSSGTSKNKRTALAV